MSRKSDAFTQSVLLIEDDLQSLQPLARLLGLCGFAVETANNGEIAKCACRARAFDFVISDLTLPDGDGCDLLRELLIVGPTIPIALTGWDQDEVSFRCKSAGFLAILVKPIDIRELLKVMHDLTNKSAPLATRALFINPEIAQISPRNVAEAAVPLAAVN